MTFHLQNAIGGGNADPARQQIARTLADFYGELAGTVAKPAPRFSLCRAFEQMAKGGLDSGYEKEVCSSAAMIAGGVHDRNRIQLPLPAIQSRDATVAGTAGFTVGTTNTSAADVLRPYSVTGQAGITTLENLRESVLIPKVATAPTGAWLASESTAIVDATPVLAQTPLVPNMYGIMIEFSMRFLQQAATAEEFLRTQLLRAAGQAIDAAVLNGPGTGAPLGLLNASGIPAETGTSFSWAKACNILETLGTAGLDDSRVSWIASPDARELLQQREVIATSGRFVWDDDRVVNRPAYSTSDMPTMSLVAGDFSRAVLGLWGAGLTVEINPNQNFAKGILAARVLVAADCAFPTPTAFVKSTSLT